MLWNDAYCKNLYICKFRPAEVHGSRNLFCESFSSVGETGGVESSSKTVPVEWDSWEMLEVFRPSRHGNARISSSEVTRGDPRPLKCVSERFFKPCVCVWMLWKKEASTISQRNLQSASSEIHSTSLLWKIVFTNGWPFKWKKAF